MRQHKLTILFSVLIVGLAGSRAQHVVDIMSADIVDHVIFLASDDLEGRRAGTRGGRKAAQYIVREFRSYGLKPVGESGHSFKSPFEFVSGVELGRRNRLKLKSEQEMYRLRLGKDFRPLGFSSTGKAEGGLAFVGYGIESDELDYNDYGGMDTEGKVVMILRYSPDGTNPHGEFGKYAPLRYKAMTAREHGATGVIMVIGPEDDDDEEYLMGLNYDRSFADSGIPVVAITQRWAQRLFDVVGEDLEEIQKTINEEKLPNFFTIPVSVSLETSLKKVSAKTVNVVGMVEGSDAEFSDEFVVIGAHYDHLGLGGDGSMVPDTVAVHNGADDNASGTAGLLELAHWFSENPQKRSLVFAAFGGEELGLLGSSSFTKDPPVLLHRVGSMINMDMIGRMEDSTVVVGGAGTSSIWKELVQAKATEFDLTPKFDDAGYGASDHQSFYLKDIPVLFFFSGTHEDYHRPSDDAEKINAQGEERIVRLVRDIVVDLATRPVRPDFVKVQQDQPTRGGFAVYLGTIPDYAATDVEGMKLSGVREGGPADKGGMKAGDIIVRFGNKTVKSIYDFMYALQEAKAGEPVTIVVNRNGDEVALEVVPARRRD